MVEPLQESGLFKVYNGKGQAYIVDLVANTCTCPDHTFRGATCKHLIAAQHHEAHITQLLNTPIKEKVWKKKII